jgi:hypothetical protein
MTGNGTGTYAYGINGLNIVGIYDDRSTTQHAFFDNNGTFINLTGNASFNSATISPTGLNTTAIVGSYTDTSSLNHGFLYTIGNSTYTSVNDPLATNTAGKGTFATGISSTGTIVGYYYASNGLANGYFDSGGVFTTLDDSSGAEGTFVESIKGDVAVGYYLDASNISHAFYVVIPEPATWPWLAGTAALGVLGWRKRQRANKPSRPLIAAA